MDKTLFLDLIERYYNTQLSRFQLQYFFSSNRYVAASCPRRGGKSFVANLDSLYACTTPNKRVAIILPGQTSIQLAKDSIKDMARALHGYIEIVNENSKVLFFNNNSTLYFLTSSHALENYIGCRFNKVTIEEPDHIKDIETLKQTLECSMASYEDAQLKLIGTHMLHRHNLKSYMLSPYFEKVTGTIHTIYNPMNRQRLSELEAEMGDNARFRLEILNEVSPAIWNNTN